MNGSSQLIGLAILLCAGIVADDSAGADSNQGGAACESVAAGQAFVIVIIASRCAAPIARHFDL